MLLIRPKPHVDESLESYFLRLAQANGFEKYKTFVGALNFELYKHNGTKSRLLPRDLHMLNPCFAKHSSKERLKCLKQISMMTAQDVLPVLSLAIYRANQKYSLGVGSVIQQGRLYPRQFLRQSNIGICPECLGEASYIRQIWHFEPYTVCHRHCCSLIHQCACGERIDYLLRDSIYQCPECGVAYKKINVTTKADVEELYVSKWLAGDQVDTFPEVSIAHRWGLYLWWIRHREATSGSTSFNENMTQWPEFFDKYLNTCLSHFEIKAASVKHTKFSDVFGDILIKSIRLPSSRLADNLVLQHLYQFLNTQLSRQGSHLNKITVNAIEASILLGTSIDQVSALYDQGELHSFMKLKSDEIIQPHQSVFQLNELFLLWLSRFQVEGSNYHVMTSTW
ncbi:hypothetical protein TW85_15810 [Marinomonas sp. S3726]|uniref:TniQ family protein n=1 Tax=Marinomonas sp. S3726 TaxID=579484 RepID=UPI0005F9CC25|nr:TniQ family protein [Marinomonas sp. S3726]KJZ12544.1 hypothetical protein TW85_15810 [Marinomonas sp. S3726]